MNATTRQPAEGLFCALLIISSLFLWGCATSGTNQEPQAPETPVLETIELTQEGDRSIITITSSAETIYSPFFTLPSPPRICLDVKGTPGSAFSRALQAESGPVREITVQDRESGFTGLVFYLRTEGYDCAVATDGAVARIVIGPSGATPQTAVEKTASPELTASSLPRILNVEVSEPKKNRTRLTVFLDKETPYRSSLKEKTLVLDFPGSSISADLVKDLHSKAFEGIVDHVKVVHSEGGGDVSLEISLRQAIPYHVTSLTKGVQVDFSQYIKKQEPNQKVEKKAPKSKAIEKPEKAPALEKKTARSDEKKPESEAAAYAATTRRFGGVKMSFDFVNTDIRNILRLIADVADVNIVWGVDVQGRISMTLNEIPWDQALEMILKPNGLTYQIEDEVIWVVRKESLAALELAESTHKSALLMAKRAQETFEAKIVEFIMVRNRPASEIYTLLVGGAGDPGAMPPAPPTMPLLDIQPPSKAEVSAEGAGGGAEVAAIGLQISYDSSTGVIILNGVRAEVTKAKELIAKLDVPRKQVMIEARIVEASTGFARDLGIRWSSLDQSNPGFQADWYNTGSNSMGSSQFSTNAPAQWSPNIGLALGWLTGGGLGTLALDASLALAEEDQQIDILSAPRVMTVNGRPAFVSRGTVEYFPVRTENTVDYREIPALLSLMVTPTVSADNTNVTMVVDVTDDRRLPAEQRTEGGVTQESPPGRTQKKITSTLVVKTGETVVIGGIFQKEDETGDTGIPWLKDIPLLGWLFKAERKTRTQVELLIFLTPTIINSDGKEV